MKKNVQVSRRMAAVGAVVLVLFMGWLLQRDLARARDADTWVEHTLDVLRVTAEARESLARAESATRGLLLGLPDHWTAEQDRAAAALSDSTRKLLALTQDNPTQHVRAAKIVNESAARIELARGNSLGAARPDAIAAAQAASSVLYADISQFQQEERRLLAERRQAQRKQQELGLVGLACLVVLCAGLLARAYFVAGRHRRHYEAAEQRMHDLVEHLPLTVWQVQQQRDGHRRFVYLSSTAERERGWDAAMLRHDYGLVTSTMLAEDRERVDPILRNAQRDNGSFDVTYRAQGQDGRTRWIHSRAQVRSEHDGAFLWSGFWRDVSHQIATERALRDVNRQLDAFSYTVSHDLRTPLAAIMAFAAAAAAQGGSGVPMQVQQYLDKIRASGAQMQIMIEALLRLSRLSQQPIARSTVDLSRIAMEEIDSLRAAEPARKLDIDVQGDLTAEGDPALLRQVLANLIGNAWKFTRDSAHPMITVGRGTDEARSYFFVGDNGIGFEQADEEKLFRPFERLHRGGRFPGAGIRLATVAKIIERHSGQVWAESEPNSGARFMFTLGSEGEAAD